MCRKLSENCVLVSDNDRKSRTGEIMKMNHRMVCALAVVTLLVSVFIPVCANAQVLAGDQLKKVTPTNYFFAGQVASVQARNSTGLKNTAGKLVLVGLVDTSGYATAIAEKYQGFLITETKLTFDGATLEPGAYGFGFKDGKFTVMNVAGTNVFSIAAQNDDEIKHPVPLKFEKSGTRYRLYDGRKFVYVNAD